jgi:hypothetical protein
MSVDAHAEQPVEASTHGAAASAQRAPGDALLGTGAVIVWNDVAPEGREQFYAWHDKEHIPERLSIPGFRRGRRYAKLGHSPEYLTLYEAENVGTLASPEYLDRLNSPTAGTTAALRYFRNTSRAVCRLVHSTGSSSGGYMLALRLQVAPPHADAMRHFLSADAFPRAMALTGVVACHLYVADQAASHVRTAESSTREIDVPAWVLLIETTCLPAAEQVRLLIDGPELRDLGAAPRSDAATYSLEICRLALR